jgi:hypothetical protein
MTKTLDINVQGNNIEFLMTTIHRCSICHNQICLCFMFIKYSFFKCQAIEVELTAWHLKTGQVIFPETSITTN